MKSIHYEHIRDQVFVQELQNELSVLRTLDHPHIVRVRETFDWQDQLFVVMEHCAGGDLYSRDPYTETGAVRYARMILSAVAYMHSKDVYVPFFLLCITRLCYTLWSLSSHMPVLALTPHLFVSTVSIEI